MNFRNFTDLDFCLHFAFCSSLGEITEQVNEQVPQPAVTETAKGKQKSKATKKKDAEKKKGKNSQSHKEKIDSPGY